MKTERYTVVCIRNGRQIVLESFVVRNEVAKQVEVDLVVPSDRGVSTVLFAYDLSRSSVQAVQLSAEAWGCSKVFVQEVLA